jgi:molecular chaperone IbpA
MRTFTLDPYWRTSIGFERLFDLMDQSLRFEPEDNYPPCNVVRTGEDNYRISLAVAGFKPEQIDVVVQQNVLIVSGRASEKTGDEYLYRGIGARSFERRFSLADYVQVKNASFEDGLLQIELVRELPDSMKAKRIEVKTGKALAHEQAKTIDHKAA